MATEGFGEEFDSTCGVGSEDDFEMVWTGAKQAQYLFPSAVDDGLGRVGRRDQSRVGVGDEE